MSSHPSLAHAELGDHSQACAFVTPAEEMLRDLERRRQAS